MVLPVFGDGDATQVFKHLHDGGIILGSQAGGGCREKELMRNCCHRQREPEFVSDVEDDPEIFDKYVHGAQSAPVFDA